MLHVIHQDIYEPKGAGWDFPVLRHSFFGRDRAEARRYFNAHMKTDSFMRNCTVEGRFNSIVCPVREGVTHIDRVPPLSGFGEAPKRPYAALAILGLVLVGGAALLYNEARRRGG